VKIKIISDVRGFISPISTAHRRSKVRFGSSVQVLEPQSADLDVQGIIVPVDDVGGDVDVSLSRLAADPDACFVEEGDSAACRRATR
jgi:hypothetical protein